jgi:PD-(D/E)XK nuclease superfamily protein
MALHILENKTSGEDIGPGSSYWDRLSYDPQISLYMQGAEALGYAPHGVLYDVVRKPQHKPSEVKREAPEAYGERVLRAMLEEPDRYFQRGIVVRLDSEKLDAATDVWQTATNIREARARGRWPRNVDACMQWSRACEYLQLCSGQTTPDDRLIYELKKKKNLELESDADLLTQSALKTFRACAKRYYYRYELLLKLKANDPEPLRLGKSVHRALEVWWASGYDVEKALRELDDTDAFKRAKESAMVLAHHVRWESEKIKIVAVEQEWRADLVNPDSGRTSQTFVLGGKFDGIVEL